MRIGFDAATFTHRGTHVAMFDYAIYNQSLLGNQSIIFYQGNSIQHAKGVLEKFQQHLQLIPYTDLNDLDRLAEKNKIDRFYFLKSGEKDHYLLPSLPNLIHAVFPKPMSEAHGSIYAYVSAWLAEECSNHRFPFVPHIITMPDVQGDLRSELNIPQEAKVFAYYGGSDSFNIPFVKNLIQKMVQQQNTIYFIFMNTPAFIQHHQAIFLEGNSDLSYKTKFIQTADAMIHARGIGESFGLACGEFSLKNKPVITYALSPQRNHLKALGDKALLYRGPKELSRIFLEFDPIWSRQQNWDCYSSLFSPAEVMKKFDAVFLQSDLSRPLPKPSLLDEFVVQAYRFPKKIRNLSRKYYIKNY
jgi:hypothetical protein